MANLIVFDQGKIAFQKLLAALAGGNTEDGNHVHLYTAVAPALGHGTVIGDFTEAAFAGYSAQLLTGAGPVTLDGAFRAQTTFASVTFTNGSGAPQSVTGIYLTDAGDATAYAGAQFTGAPITIPAGMSLTIPITATAQSEF